MRNKPFTEWDFRQHYDRNYADTGTVKTILNRFNPVSVTEVADMNWNSSAA